MQDKSSAVAASPVLPLIAGAFAIGIFLVDTITPLDIAVGVLYVIVVLIAANFLQRRGVLLVAAACLALTVLSFLLTHGLDTGQSLARCVMSVSAIGATTFLALKNQSANEAVRDQARLLDLTHDTVFVRDMNDVITYWNRGAEELYGFRRDEAIGKVSHELMQTVFPVPLDEITAELLRAGRWEGDLIHARRDGTRVTVSSRWSLQRDERGRPVATMETNNDITERNQAQNALRLAEAELAHINRVMTLKLTPIARGQPTNRRDRGQRSGLPAWARPGPAGAGGGARGRRERDQRRHARERRDPADSRPLQEDRSANGEAGYQRRHRRCGPPGRAGGV